MDPKIGFSIGAYTGPEGQLTTQPGGESLYSRLKESCHSDILEINTVGRFSFSEACSGDSSVIRQSYTGLLFLIRYFYMICIITNKKLLMQVKPHSVHIFPTRFNDLLYQTNFG